MTHLMEKKQPVYVKFVLHAEDKDENTRDTNTQCKALRSEFMNYNKCRYCCIRYTNRLVLCRARAAAALCEYSEVDYSCAGSPTAFPSRH